MKVRKQELERDLELIVFSQGIYVNQEGGRKRGSPGRFCRFLAWKKRFLVRPNIIHIVRSNSVPGADLAPVPDAPLSRGTGQWTVAGKL